MESCGGFCMNMAYRGCYYTPYSLYVTKVRTVNVFSAQSFQWVVSAKVAPGLWSCLWYSWGKFQRAGWGACTVWEPQILACTAAVCSQDESQQHHVWGHEASDMLLPPAWETVNARVKYVGILFTGFGQNGVQDENPIPHPWSWALGSDRKKERYKRQK